MNRESGAMLVEMTIAGFVLTMGVLGFMAMFAANFKGTQELTTRDQAHVAMERVAEQLRSSDFDTLFADYNGVAFEAPGVAVGSSGTTTTYPNGGTTSSNAYVQCSMYVNETALPAEFGPLLDIDGVGGLESTNCSTTYKVLPVQLSLAFATNYGSETLQQYLVLSKQ